MLRANLRILTSDAGLNNYTSIPLEGKKRYKVANAVGFSQVFSIVAFTVNDQAPGVVIRRGATERRINFEMEWLSDIVIHSSTGAVYVNVSSAAEKTQFSKGTLNAAGGIGSAAIVKNIIDLGTTLYKWYSPSTDDPEFEFSIGARETKNTKLKIQGEATLGSIASQLTSVGAFESKQDLGKYAYEQLAFVNEFKGNVVGSAKGASSTFKYLFG